MTGFKPTIAVDFDGVIHSYTSPWSVPEQISDPPVEGAIKWLNEISENFDITIFTTRGSASNGVVAVSDWLRLHGVKCSFEVTAKKPPALVYIDDRAYRFTGANWPTVQEIHEMIPWNKPGAVVVNTKYLTTQFRKLNTFEAALRTIRGPSDDVTRFNWHMNVYRDAGGGYEGLQAIAQAALDTYDG